MYKLITQLQSVKTSFLDIAALIYGIGLVNWSIHAYQHSLGIVSAFDMQYFIGGIVPFLLLLCIYYIVNTQFASLGKWYAKNKLRTKKLRRDNSAKLYSRLKWKISILMVFFTLLMAVNAYLEKSLIFGFTALFSIVVWFYTIRSINAKATNQNAKTANKSVSFSYKRRLYRWLHPVNVIIFYAKFWAILMAICFIIAYALLIYPVIPQELGGAKSKHCFIECAKGSFSPQTTEALFKDTSAALIQSRELEVYYYNSDKMILKAGNNAQTLELNRKDIVLITWINK